VDGHGNCVVWTYSRADGEAPVDQFQECRWAIAGGK
jgi:hypothetical protein